MIEEVFGSCLFDDFSFVREHDPVRDLAREALFAPRATLPAKSQFDPKRSIDLKTNWSIY